MTNDELQELNDKLNADLMEAQAEIERLRNAAPATAPSHTEAEVQELLHDDREMTEERFEISVRRILGVPAP